MTWTDLNSACPPDQPGIEFLGETCLTFGVVRSKAGAIADALGAAGLKPGDIVAIATSHGASFYACFAACWSCGYPLAIIDPGAGLHELSRMLHKAAPTAFIADDEVLQRLTDNTKEILPRNTWRVGPFRPKTTLNSEAVTGRKALVSDYPSFDEFNSSTSVSVDAPGRGASAAYIIFTSGTTSSPKAVVVSRDSLRYHVDTLSRVFGYDQEARLLHYLPTHHTDGLVHGVAASLFMGMTVVHPGPFSALVNLEQALHVNNISHFLAVPTMLSIIRHSFGDRPELFQYGHFRNLISTAGNLDPKFWDEFQKFYGVRVSNFYGMTETVSGSLYCGPADDSYRIGTVGKPIDSQARIVDECGTPLAIGKVGELMISGKHLMSAYLGDPEITKTTITDGWLSTGDLFFQDADGFFHIVGRKKNIIKRGGITVYPEDIRRVLVKIPGIVEVEVVGIPDATFEEIIVVCAVVEDGLGADEIRTLCRQKLSPERRPDRVELLDRLPRGPSGKVQREALILKLGRITSQLTSRDAPMRSRVLNLAATVFATDPATLDEASSPNTVDNWDSFAGMEFVLALEQEFELRLSAPDIMRIRNIGQAIEVISRATRPNEMNA